MTYKQSFAWWCFSQVVRDARSFFRSARQIGYLGVELLPQELWVTALEEGLTIVSEGVGSLTQGLNRIENHVKVENELIRKLDAVAEHKIPNLIVFSGNRDGLGDKTGAINTITGLKKLAPIAEERGICLVLELLNSKVDHPDYQCDHTDWAVEVISQVSSPSVKILYDIYHMQIMEGDIIRNIRTHGKYFGHIHTAGNPGRRDMDEEQELYYPPILKSLREIGYTGFVGHEFIPKDDPLKALEYAYHLSQG